MYRSVVKMTFCDRAGLHFTTYVLQEVTIIPGMTFLYNLVESRKNLKDALYLQSCNVSIAMPQSNWLV